MPEFLRIRVTVTEKILVGQDCGGWLLKWVTEGIGVERVGLRYRVREPIAFGALENRRREAV